MNATRRHGEYNIVGRHHINNIELAVVRDGGYDTELQQFGEVVMLAVGFDVRAWDTGRVNGEQTGGSKLGIA